MRAYANLDPEFGFEVGYNWLTNTLLYYNNGDEERTFWSLVSVMIDKGWKGFYTSNENGVPHRTARLSEEMDDFLMEHIPRAQAKIEEDFPTGSHLLGCNFVNQLHTSLFTRAVPIEISRYILDVFFWEGLGEITINRILGNMLEVTEDLALKEEDTFKYYGLNKND
jgi:hypothetical protein